MKFVTIVHNRPDFIKLQLDSIKKHFRGDFEYIVWIDSWDDEDRTLEIRKICSELGIEHYRIEQREFDFTDEFKYGPAQHMVITLNWLWRNYIEKQKGLLCYLDSDMFLVKDIDDKFVGGDIAFLPMDGYIWSGLQFFNMDTLPNPQDIRWDVEHIGTKWGTMGAATLRWLEKEKPKIKYLERDYLNTNEGMFEIFKSEGEPFLIHYGAASNYEDIRSPEYIKNKTETLKKWITALE